MFRFAFIFCCILSPTLATAQRIVSYGIFTGATIPFTNDIGINKDPRYQPRYDLKFAPVGISYGVDYDGFGYIVSPSLIRTGENFNIINTVGGLEGIRKIDLQYINIPVGFKLHIIDLSFFKLSLVASGSFAYLLKAKETITHHTSKLRFPVEVTPILPDDYTKQYDGVIVPALSNYATLSKSDFNPYQINVGAGLISDWDISDNFRLALDLRANYGLLEPRNNAYKSRLKNYQTLYEIPGTRKDIFVYLNLSILHYFERDKKDGQRGKRIKGTPQKKQSRYPWAKPRRSNPK